jgi:hypothetical protein
MTSFRAETHRCAGAIGVVRQDDAAEILPARRLAILFHGTIAASSGIIDPTLSCRPNRSAGYGFNSSTRALSTNQMESMIF